MYKSFRLKAFWHPDYFVGGMFQRSDSEVQASKRRELNECLLSGVL